MTGLGHLRDALTSRPLLGDLAGHPVVGDDQEVVTRAGHGREAEHPDRTRRVGHFDRLHVVVEHRPDAAEGLATDDRLADPQGAALNQHGRHGAAALVEVGFDRQALGVHVGVGAEVELRVGRQQDRLEQVVDAGALLGRDVDEQGRATELLGHQAVFGELGTDLGRVGALLVDLVHRHHDRHVGRLRVVESLDRLGLHTVVGRDHQHRDVGGLRTTGTHGGERLVTRGVDEGDLAVFAFVLRVDLVGTDVLGDAAGLARHHVGVADGVEELGLAVVDVTHDGHDRRTRREVGLVALVFTELDLEGLEQLTVLLLGRDDLDDVVQLGAEELQRLLVHRLGRGHHLTEVEHDLDQRRRVRADAVGEVGQRGAARRRIV